MSVSAASRAQSSAARMSCNAMPWRRNSSATAMLHRYAHFCGGAATAEQSTQQVGWLGERAPVVKEARDPAGRTRRAKRLWASVYRGGGSGTHDDVRAPWQRAAG